jgi:hypothetical protein
MLSAEQIAAVLSDAGYQVSTDYCVGTECEDRFHSFPVAVTFSPKSRVPSELTTYAW